MIVTSLAALSVQSGSFWSELLDPKDGRFDVSQMLARLGLRSGVDVARGPEEWTVYLQIGNAW